MNNNQDTRQVTDSFGTLDIPAEALWGAQTARSLHFFSIGSQRMPLEIIHALAWIKWAAACVNSELGRLDSAKSQAICDAALRVAAGEFEGEFPLSVWQTGSGTQSNMNVNEVIATLASHSMARTNALANTLQLAQQQTAQRTTPNTTIHPNDDVNLGQSSNDVFPTAMHIALALLCKSDLLPALQSLRATFAQKSITFQSIIKIGRTHLQDATPITFGQEFSGYEAQLMLCEDAIRHALLAIHTLAIGGTAVGTGVNTHPEFGKRVTEKLSLRLHLPLSQATNLFAAMAGHEAVVAFHAALRMLAIALTKIGNDLRLMGSGPRAGLAELQLPQNEPGSSIMPGKVNPTQIEALTMVCAQVMGHDAAIGFAASQGQFELNVYKPLIALNALDSLHLLADAMRSFERHCVLGIEVNQARATQLLDASLMLVTALTPHIGYDKAAQIAKHAAAHEMSLRDAALTLGLVTAAQFEQWVKPADMLAPHSSQ